MCEASAKAYQDALGKPVKTTIKPVGDMIYYVAEESHQQYDAKPGSRKYANKFLFHCSQIFCGGLKGN